MKISLKWLSDYIDVSEFFQKPQELSAILTAAGLEVEGVQNLAKQFEHVVVAHILEKNKHPNADKLSLCQVSTGDGRVHQIVCGAQNHKSGDNVVLALPGAVLPGDFAIKLSKIRGVESGGMLCSQKELGLAETTEGIVILPADAPIGKPFAEYMGFDDILFELKVTPNRADCLSHVGLARELACLLGREMKMPAKELATVSKSTKEQVALVVKATDVCPRYAGRFVGGIKVGPSPDWLKKRLEAVGLNSINNIVDVTNFVMMELGQSLHAFDVRELKGRKVVVERAQAGEAFTTLDGTELKLTGEELTIRDAERPVALAGIVGGLNSGIQNDTQDVFIESAYFSPGAVRRTGRKFGVETDSSYRFSRGVNPEMVPFALDRAARLMQEVAGGEVYGDAYDNYPQPLPRPRIEVSVAFVEERLGYKVDSAKFAEWMKRLGCEVTELAAAGAGTHARYAVVPPPFRGDLTMDADLIEEYARLDGYQNIPENLPGADLIPSAHDNMFMLERKVRRLWQGQGYFQALNFNFIGQRYQEKVLGAAEKLGEYGLKMSSQPVMLVNPLNEDLNCMRTSLVPLLLKNVTHNSRYGNPYGRLFEVGAAYFKGSEEGIYGQETRLGAALWGQREGLFDKGEKAPVVFELKAAVENFLRGMAITKWKWVMPTEPRQVPDFMHPGQCAGLQFEGKLVGFIGTLHPVLQEEYKIREQVALAEFNLEKLMNGQPRSPKFKSIPKFPAVERDIALLMPKELTAGEVEAFIRQSAGELLQEVRVFDVFEGGTLAAGQKSVAFRLIFQDSQGTLEDEKVNGLRDKVVQSVSQKFSISLR